MYMNVINHAFYLKMTALLSKGELKKSKKYYVYILSVLLFIS